ncbi:Cof-like hydrolase [Pseudopedobacter saltans DSM 12145]|uniref:Cof-like hydrolase n=2 Tax=Pseudopedobacter saltans TaxID=151895 RepID=F0S523_PSESL|nr:Cof-like hydrolase [Pseudopedobacter saltans DSM 12145]
MIKAVFFDVDGTLISFETHKIPQSTLDAIKTLKEKGIKIIVATGRSTNQLSHLKEIDFDGYLTFNGNLCVGHNKEIFHKRAIPKENIEALIKYQKEVKRFPCIFMSEFDNKINYVDNEVIEVFNLLNLPLTMETETMEEGLKKDIIQMNVFINPDEDEHLIQNALTECETSRWTHLFADVNLKNSNKGTGLIAFTKHLDIDISETLAFGDGGNDIEMLKTAGIGIAMGNANREVKAIADYITDAVDGDGIANALKHFGVI